MDTELQVEEVEKRGTRIEREKNSFISAGSDHFESEILAEIRKVKNKDLEDMVDRMELTYNEIVDILDLKCIATSCDGYTLPPCIYEIRDLNYSMSNFSLRDHVKLRNTVDDIRRRSNLTTNRTKKFTKKWFLNTILGFTQSHSGPLNEPPKREIELTAGTYKCEKPSNITG